MPLLLGMLRLVTPPSKVRTQHLGTVEYNLQAACTVVIGCSSPLHYTHANALVAKAHVIIFSTGCCRQYCQSLVVVTGGLMNWRVWYLGLVWLLMESALFGIIFW